MSKQNCDFIRNIKAYEFKKYSGVSSREKLIVYTIKYLTDNGIPATFDYVCMAAFKFFPEEFKLSDEFPEQADIAGLNRTLMHLRPSERNLATGKPNTEYELNENGLALANQVEDGLKNDMFSSEAALSRHDEVVTKKNKEKYLSFVKNPIYKTYLETKNYTLDLLWRIFKVMPFSKMDVLLEDVREIKEIAKPEKDGDCLELCILMEDDLKKLLNAKREGIKTRR